MSGHFASGSFANGWHADAVMQVKVVDQAPGSAPVPAEIALLALRSTHPWAMALGELCENLTHDSTPIYSQMTSKDALVNVFEYAKQACIKAHSLCTFEDAPSPIYHGGQLGHSGSRTVMFNNNKRVALLVNDGAVGIAIGVEVGVGMRIY